MAKCRNGVKYVPEETDRAKVEALASIGVRQTIIADYMGMDTVTLIKHFRAELDHGLTNRSAKVANALFEKAVYDKDTAALIFLGKTLCRLRETNRVEVANAEEQPFRLSMDVKKIDEALKSRCNEILSRNDDGNRDESK